MKSPDIYEGGVSIEWKLDMNNMGYKRRDPSEIKRMIEQQERQNLKQVGGVIDGIGGSIFNGAEYVPIGDIKP